MFGFGEDAAIASPEFVPDPDARGWIHDGLGELYARLGRATAIPRVLAPLRKLPADLDAFFDAICGVQEEIGQSDVEFTLVETIPGQAPQVPDDYAPLADTNGRLFVTLHGRGEYVFLFTATMFRQAELAHGAIARELGRIAVHRAGGPGAAFAPDEADAEAELAAVALGLGPWVTNGSYIFENACCGGGCGINTRNLKVGLSLPESAYATAFDAHRKGLSRRAIAKFLEANQKAAFKKSFALLDREAPPALTAAREHAALAAG